MITLLLAFTYLLLINWPLSGMVQLFERSRQWMYDPANFTEIVTFRRLCYRMVGYNVVMGGLVGLTSLSPFENGDAAYQVLIKALLLAYSLSALLAITFIYRTSWINKLIWLF